MRFLLTWVSVKSVVVKVVKNKSLYVQKVYFIVYFLFFSTDSVFEKVIATEAERLR